MADINTGDGTVQLPEALLEKIVAGISFPQVFKARLLSKEWNSKFPIVVTQAATRWPQYFPALIGSRGIEACDVVFQSMKRLVSTYVRVEEVKSGENIFAASGALMATMDSSVHLQTEATVVNLLTGKKREISCPDCGIMSPNANWRKFSRPILVPVQTNHYELVICYTDLEGPRETTNVNVYSSRSRDWVQQSFNYASCGGLKFGAFLDGVLYCLTDVAFNRARYQPGVRPRIMGFDTRTGIILHSLVHLQECDVENLLDNYMIRCGSRILVINFLYNPHPDLSQVKVYQLDTQYLELKLLGSSEFPVLFHSFSSLRPLVSVTASTTRAYILRHDKHILTTYDVESNTWSSTSSIRDKFLNDRGSQELRCFVFEPGLNTFVLP